MQQLTAGHLHRVKAILFDVHLATMASRTTLYVYSLPDNVGCDAVSPIATRDKSYRVKPCLFTDILNLGGSLADPHLLLCCGMLPGLLFVDESGAPNA